jgi:uncharacterized protein
LIFVDTSFWAALTGRSDQRHGDAVQLFEQYGAHALLTSNQIRGETWTLLRRRRSHRDAVAFLDLVERSARLSIVSVPEELEQEALRWLRRHDEREYSFIDASSFALMRSLKIRDALAFDGDFAAAGFTELRPS